MHHRYARLTCETAEKCAELAELQRELVVDVVWAGVILSLLLMTYVLWRRDGESN